MSHTPGPWTFLEHDITVARDGIDTFAGDGSNEYEAFERVASAARAAADLLAALERARQHLVMNEWVDDEGARRRFAAAKEAEAAIAKAKETP